MSVTMSGEDAFLVTFHTCGTLQDMPTEGQSGLVHTTRPAADSYTRVRDVSLYTRRFSKANGMHAASLLPYVTANVPPQGSTEVQIV